MLCEKEKLLWNTIFFSLNFLCVCMSVHSNNNNKENRSKKKKLAPLAKGQQVYCESVVSFVCASICLSEVNLYQNSSRNYDPLKNIGFDVEVYFAHNEIFKNFCSETAHSISTKFPLVIKKCPRKFN